MTGRAAIPLARLTQVQRRQAGLRNRRVMRSNTARERRLPRTGQTDQEGKENSGMKVEVRSRIKLTFEQQQLDAFKF